MSAIFCLLEGKQNAKKHNNSSTRAGRGGRHAAACAAQGRKFALLEVGPNLFWGKEKEIVENSLKILLRSTKIDF